MPRDALLDMYMKDVSAYPVLSKDEERTVATAARGTGPGAAQAKQRMIQSNLRLVVSVARHFECQGLALLDVIEEGNIGLMRAVDRFDPTLECRFSTYAVHWIKQAIRRALIDKVRNIRVPAYMAELVMRWKRHCRETGASLAADHEPGAVARALGISARNTRLAERVLRTSQQGSCSLDGDEDGGYGHMVEDEQAAQPDVELHKDEDRALLQQALSRLEEREAEILRYRFGLDAHPVLTLEEIGTVFNLTRERIRQLEAKALGELRSLLSSESVM